MPALFLQLSVASVAGASRGGPYSSCSMRRLLAQQVRQETLDALHSTANLYSPRPTCSNSLAMEPPACSFIDIAGCTTSTARLDVMYVKKVGAAFAYKSALHGSTKFLLMLSRRRHDAYAMSNIP